MQQIVLKSHTPYYANCAQCAKSFTPLWHTHIYSAWSWDLLCQLKLICHTLLTPLYPTIYEVILHTLTEANIPLSARKWAIFCRFILLTMAWDEITYKRPFREILVYIEEQHLLARCHWDHCTLQAEIIMDKFFSHHHGVFLKSKTKSFYAVEWRIGNFVFKLT